MEGINSQEVEVVNVEQRQGLIFVRVFEPVWNRGHHQSYDPEYSTIAWLLFIIIYLFVISNTLSALIWSALA